MSETPIITFDPATKTDGVKADLGKLISGKLAVQANSGGGKSWLVRTLLEDTHGQVQHFIIDPEGEYYTLREVFPDYVILARSGGDLDVTPDTAAQAVRSLVDANTNVILDLSDWGPAERDTVCAGAVNALMREKMKGRTLLIVADEAQTLAPQSGQTAAGTALIDVAMRGRKRGYGLVIATARIALLDKSLLSMCLNRLFGLTTLGNDVARAADELGFSGKEKQELRKLSEGEFFAFGPAISQDVVKVRSHGVRSTHVKPGQIVPPTPPASDELMRMLEAIRQQAAEPEEDVDASPDVQHLHRRIAELERTQAETKALRERIEYLERRITQAAPLAEQLLTVLRNGQPEPELMEAAPVAVQVTPVAAEPPARVSVSPSTGKLSGTSLTGPQQRVLDALATYESFGQRVVDRTAAAVMAGYKPSSGHINNVFGSLNVSGLISYPQPGSVTLTDVGRKAAKGKPIRSLADVHDVWRAICNNPQRKILDVLLNMRGKPISREQLAAQAAYTPGTGHFNNVVGSLHTLGAVEYPQQGYVKASALLYPAGLK